MNWDSEHDSSEHAEYTDSDHTEHTDPESTAEYDSAKLMMTLLSMMMKLPSMSIEEI